MQTGDVIRISRGSEPARLYADLLEKMDILELMIAGSEINPAKKTPLTLKNNFSPELRRKIIAGYIKKKMNEKYTWAMIMREFGYTTAKKTLNNPLEFFNNATEVAKNIPADFWEATTDGTVASKVAGDGLSLLIESASKKASLIVDSALFVSQSVNIYARSTASENAFKNPYPIVVAYAKPTKNRSARVPSPKPTNSAKSDLLVDNPSQVKSVQQIREQIRSQLNFQKWCASKGCLAPRAMQVCTLVDILNTRVSGKIFKPRIKSQNELQIGKDDLQLMQKIWNNCLLVPYSDLFSGTTKEMVRVYSPRRCKDNNEIRQSLRLSSNDCSYEKYIDNKK